jgi:hypothetical protein
MPGDKLGERKPYLAIIQGNLRQAVDEGTPDAEKRDYETPQGKKGTKFELIYKNWTGSILNLKIKEHPEYGEFLNIEFEDAVISINAQSRYFADIVKKLASVDINKPVTLVPYDFEVDGKRKSGVVVNQDGAKIISFYDQKDEAGKWHQINGFPEVEGDRETFKKDDWKIYFLKVKQFLIGEVEKINSKIIIPAPKELTQEEIDKMKDDVEQPEIPTIKDEEEINIADVPF